MSTPTPVVVCGRSPQIATGVKTNLLPEYEVIHVILTDPAGTSELPLLLRGETPKTENEVGTRNYSKPPVAIILGGGYEDASYNAFREACKGSGGVSWLRLDMNGERPKAEMGTPAYGAGIAERLKAKLEGMKGDGELGTEGLFLF